MSFTTSQGRKLQLGKQLGKGGEGAVHEALNENDIAVKIYWPHKAAERRDKISAMVSAAWFKSSTFVAFPIDVLYSANGTFVGFVMRKIGAHKPIHLLYSPASRKREFATANFRFLVHTALNVARAVASVHATSCVIGDINHSGFLVSDKATITLIDSDSFQVTAANRNFLCTVGTPEYTPPEIQGHRFDRAKRTVNHDNFGLATLIFQLLFMGRHPFSGRYLKSGEMPLERAIAEFRFAYSSRHTETQMAPPPGVPLLTDFPRYIGDAFEAAFGRPGTSRRPTAADWVALLEKLKGELQKCSASSAHQHVTGKRCPFCAMEQASPGFVAFLSGQQNFPPIHVDIKSLIAHLNSLHEPGPMPDIQTVVTIPNDLRISPCASQIVRSIRRRVWIALAASVSGVSVTLFWPTLAIPGLVSLGGGLVAAFMPVAGLAEVGNALTQAEIRWRSVKDAWNSQDGSRRVLELKNAAHSAIRLLEGLPEKEKQGLQQLETKKKENQLTRHLEAFDIASARIRKIGSGRKIVLASHGIETAADVEQYRIQNVPGFGPALASELVVWRRSLERKFSFNPREPLNPIQVSALRAELTKRKVEWEGKLRSEVLNLQNAIAHARELRTTLGRSAQHAFAQMKQVELDQRRASGFFFKPAQAVAVLCAALGVLSWGMLSRGVTPPAQVQKVDVENKTGSRSLPPAGQTGQQRATPSVADRVVTEPPSASQLPPAVRPLPQAEAGLQKRAVKEFGDSSQTAAPLPRPGAPPSNATKPTPGIPAPPGMGGPLIPVPMPESTPAPKVVLPLGPPKEIALPQTSPGSDRLLDLSQPVDAMRVQQWLIELEILAGAADGVWGPRSRKALQEFRGAHGLPLDDTWDAITQKRLSSELTKLRSLPNSISYIGAWGISRDQCRQAQVSQYRLTIASRRAEVDGSVCEFASAQRENQSSWRVQAVCNDRGERWSESIRLTVLGQQLTWASERTTKTYVRCSGP